MKLKDKVALVTGTSPNIGGGIAEGLAAEGAALVCVDASAANATDCAKYITSTGGRALGLVCDVTDEAQVSATVKRACDSFGRIDVLVNNAVIFNKKGVLNMPLAEWRKQIDVILTGAFLFTKYVAQSMIERTGARQHHQHRLDGRPSGRAEQHRLLDGQVRPAQLHPLRRNGAGASRHPGEQPYAHRDRPVRILGARAALGPRAARTSPPPCRSSRCIARRIPMQKLPKPSDYGRAAAFIASSEADMMTGTDLRIDAGAIARYWPWDPSQR